MHDLIGSLNPHRHNIGARLGFEDQASYAPLEVSHAVVGFLVDFSFGEDVDPGVSAGGVGGW